jgi:hypothetical protein
MMNKLQDLKAKLDFWYVKHFFKLDKQYTFFMDLSNPKNLAVKLLGKFDGVIVEYSNIEMTEDGQLTFDFNIIANPNLCNTNSNSFKRFTANVMRSIILASVAYAEKVIDENRNSDLVESDAERSIHEESIAVSEERVPERKSRKKGIRGSKKVRSTVQQSAADSSTGDQS